ncbi:MAG: hypothetical protein NZ802_07180 [Candidatus Poseidoniales archaeon]|nr:hypothetical protein [Candidatus Poseidoniales archaeon]
MSEPTYPHEEPFSILDWPLLMPILVGIFLSECIVGGWVWTALPEWRWLVYLIITIDLLTLIVIYVMIVRAKTGNLVSNNDSDAPDESQ